MITNLFSNITGKEKEDAIKSLIENSSPRHDFFLMVGLSVLMATFGLLLNSVAVIIGSMLIAPLLYPLLSLGLGVVISDTKLVWRSTVTIIKSTVIGVGFAAVSALLFTGLEFELTSEIIARTEPSLAYAVVAIIAGLAASFAYIKPNLNERLAGVAISVALIPPIAVMGIGIARFDWILIRASFVLFLVNVVGIIFASMIIFSLMNLYAKKQIVKEAVKADEKEIKKETEKLKEN